MEDAQGLIRTNARMPQEHLISSRDGQDGHYILMDQCQGLLHK